MRGNKHDSEAHAVILFDGVCHLCQGAVKFIIKRDPSGRFRFASQQSDIGRRLLAGTEVDSESMDTIVLIDENGEVHTRSSAAIRIAGGLRFPWPLLTVLRWVPRRLRDRIYDLVAASRYRWFGKDDACMVPTPEIRKRFL